MCAMVNHFILILSLNKFRRLQEISLNIMGYHSKSIRRDIFPSPNSKTKSVPNQNLRGSSLLSTKRATYYFIKLIVNYQSEDTASITKNDIKMSKNNGNKPRSAGVIRRFFMNFIHSLWVINPYASNFDV